MVGFAVTLILVSMAGGWLCRNLLLRLLRERHPDVYASLGQPSTRHLASLLPKHGEMQVRFWTYLWSAGAVNRADRAAAGLAWAARGCDVVLAVGIALLLYAGSRT